MTEPSAGLGQGLFVSASLAPFWHSLDAGLTLARQGSPLARLSRVLTFVLRRLWTAQSAALLQQVLGRCSGACSAEATCQSP